MWQCGCTPHLPPLLQLMSEPSSGGPPEPLPHCSSQGPWLCKVPGESGSGSTQVSPSSSLLAPPLQVVPGSRHWKEEPMCCHHCPQLIWRAGKPQSYSCSTLALGCRQQLYRKPGSARKSGSSRMQVLPAQQWTPEREGQQGEGTGRRNLSPASTAARSWAQVSAQLLPAA